jgi:hypothetical protein
LKQKKVGQKSCEKIAQLFFVEIRELISGNLVGNWLQQKGHVFEKSTPGEQRLCLR